ADRARRRRRRYAEAVVGLAGGGARPRRRAARSAAAAARLRRARRLDGSGADARRRETGGRLSEAAVNLASRPFANTRPLRRVAALLWLVGAVLAVVVGLLYWR